MRLTPRIGGLWAFAVTSTSILVTLLVLIYVVLLNDRALYNQSGPAEGYFWSVIQYQRSLALVRRYVYEHAIRSPGEKQTEVRALVGRWKDNLRTQLEVLANAHDYKPFFEQMEPYRETVPFLLALDRDLDQLILHAMQSEQGMIEFISRLDVVDWKVNKLAAQARNAYDMTELQEAYLRHRSAKKLQALAIGALIIVAWIGALSLYSGWSKSREGERRLNKALEAERIAGEQTQKTLQARTALLGMVSHELRTPLAQIMADAELIGIYSVDARIPSIVERLISAAERIDQHISDLAEYANLSSHRADHQETQLDLQRLLGEMTREFEPLARRKGLAFVVELEENIRQPLNVNPTRVGQILHNLVSNAIKYTNEGSVSILAKVCHDPDRSCLLLSVRDTGPGIPESEQQGIWEPFFRGSRRHGTAGFGLGLAVVKLTVQSVGGKASVSSQPGLGSIFTVSIPLRSTS